jgi:hypothetical protein
MSNTLINATKLQKINRSAISTFEKEIIDNVKSLIDYRRKISIEILNTKPEDGIFYDLINAYDFINEQIKNILSI